MNPNYKKTDLSKNFVFTGERPQNFIKGDSPDERYEGNPKKQRLVELKKQYLNIRNHPAMYLKTDIKKQNLKDLGEFDIILCDPPWKEYQKRADYFKIRKRTEKMEGWSLNDIANLNLGAIAAETSFLFLWVGEEHLDDGRALFKAWGFKRCEDIIWIKSNISGHKNNLSYKTPNSCLKRVKEHCLVGLRDLVNNKNDPFFIHPNIDTDVILSEQPDWSKLDKPNELYEIIERFCLGRRKLNLFGNTRCVRKGWLVVGKDLNHNNYSKEVYDGFFEGEVSNTGYKGGKYMGTTDEIERIRPKSPPKSSK